MKFKAIFFDMDGVLYDSMPAHEYSWIETFRAESIVFEPQDAYLNEGRTGRGTINLVFQKNFQRDATEEEINRIYDRKTEFIKKYGLPPIMPYMRELVFFLRDRGVDCYVVTGSKQPILMERLKNDYNFERDHIVCGNDVKFGKPDPEPYLIALGRTKLRIEECAVVENAPLGVRSAKAAKLYCYAVNTGKLEDKFLTNEGCDILFNRTEALLLHFKAKL